MESDAFFDALAAVPNFRTAAFTDLEMKPQSKGFKFRGHAAVFDEEAVIDEIPGLGVLTESVQRGAFRKVLQQNANIPFTLEHDPKMVYATTKSGRLHLAEDTKGLAVDADLPDTSLSRDLQALVEADIVTGMSFGFVTGTRDNHRIEQRSNGRHRILTGFKKLLDVCATWDPTYPSAEAQFRSQAMLYVNSPNDWQQLLMGAYPQLQDSGRSDEGTDEDATPADEPDAPDGDEPAVVEGDDSRVAEHRSVAARKRALSLYLINAGDDLS
jgi:HK97 family phage prohead protease